MRIATGLCLVGGLVLTTPVAQAQIFQDTFDSYPQGWWPPAFLAVWPDDGCANVKIHDGDGIHIWSPPNSALQARDPVDDHAVAVRHRHEFTAAELQGAAAAQPGASAVQGTDANPLHFEYFVDLDYDGWFWHNRFMEMTCSTDRAPTPMTWTTCPENGKTRRYLDPNGDGQVHGSIAVGVVAMTDTTPCGTLGQGDEKHEVDHLVVYDGRYWRILEDYPTDGDSLPLCNRWNRIYVDIRTSEIDIRIVSRYNTATGNCDADPKLDKTVTIPREYLGPFTAIVMGGVVDEQSIGQCVSSVCDGGANHGGACTTDTDCPPATGCIEEGSPGTDVQHNHYRDWLDNVTVQGGAADVYADPCPDIQVFGACCVRTGWGWGTCSITTQDDCENNLGGTYLGNGTGCGTNNENCDFCPDPFADTDRDLDVDQQDFGVFQACVTGQGATTLDPNCECLDRDNDGAGDGDVDQDDWGTFEACASGPDVPADPTCGDPT